ncbi:hypothetical protein Tco_0719482 [Tanacetum coccineum]
MNTNRLADALSMLPLLSLSLSMACDEGFSHGGRSSLRYSFEPHIRWHFVSFSPTQVESTLAMRSGQTVTIVGQQQQLLHLSKQTLRGNDARTFELVQNWSWNRKQGKRKDSKMELELNIRKEKFTFSMPTFPGKHPSLTIQLLFVDEALEIPYSYWDGAGHRQVMRVILFLPSNLELLWLPSDIVTTENVTRATNLELLCLATFRQFYQMNTMDELLATLLDKLGINDTSTNSGITRQNNTSTIPHLTHMAYHASGSIEPSITPPQPISQFNRSAQ